ncbi:MAG: hypothetical protein GY820_02105 [Gammaproteobacteria bacterium]|nr:hypothetical protein [Gammaproteobacteria bacterium]
MDWDCWVFAGDSTTLGRGPLCFGRGPHDMDMAGDRAIWHMVTVSQRI